jgi:hypothetical protein
MNVIEPVEPIAPAAPSLGSVAVRAVVGLWNWLVAATLCQVLVFSVLVVGWVQRVSRRWIVARWWELAGAPGADFPEFVRGDVSTEDLAAWPSWILGPKRNEPPTWRARMRRLAGGLWENLRLGILSSITTAILVLPGSLIWAGAWYAGWQNSFNKGYEHAWLGPTLFILGIPLWIAAMLYVPMAQMRQASTARWQSFFEVRLVWHLIQRRWLASVGLASLYAVLNLVPSLTKIAPIIGPLTPGEVAVDLASALSKSEKFHWNVTFAALIPALMLLRRVAARNYATAVRDAVQAGSISEDQLADGEWTALQRLGLIAVRPAPERSRWMRLLVWLGTRTGQIVAAAVTAGLWAIVVAQILVSEFVVKTDMGRGWWNQPLIQMPWFDYTPQRLRTEVEQPKKDREEPGSRSPVEEP